LKSSLRPSFLMTQIGWVTNRSWVVKRIPQFGQSLLLRTAEPLSMSRESMTFVPEAPQRGQSMNDTFPLKPPTQKPISIAADEKDVPLAVFFARKEKP
jgi:hypothetical protein